MANGDVTISVAVAGGVTKSVILTSATRVKSKLAVTTDISDLSDDADWQSFEVNKFASTVVSQANSQIASESSWVPKTFTRAT